MEQRLTQTQSLELKQFLSLVQEKILHSQTLEHALVEQIKFKNIEFDGLIDEHHLDILSATLEEEAGWGMSIIERVLRINGLDPDEDLVVKLKSFDVEDVGFDIGTKRYVDRMTIVLKKGGTPLDITISLDREVSEDIDQSPSINEARILGDLDTEKVFAAQKVYGARTLKTENGPLGVICKEFVKGRMLAEILDEHPEDLELVLDAVTEAVVNFLEEAEGLPEDSNPFNFILDKVNKTNKYLARYCDVEDILEQQKDIERELKILSRSFGARSKYFLETIIKKYNGDLVSDNILL